MSQHRPISPIVAAALERNREKLNARFARARRGGAGLDGEAFLTHVRETIAPIVESAGRVAPQSVDFVLEGLFELSIELFAAGLIGPGRKSAMIAELWRRVLPPAGRALDRGARLVAASLSNAAFHIERTSGARGNEWINCMARVAEMSDSSAEFLEAGKVAAWRCGMAQYRGGALQAARGLRPALAGAILEVAETDVCRVLDRIGENPWLTPSAAMAGGTHALRIVGRAGAFRGFGGEFLAPPRVWQHNGDLIAGDGYGQWLIVCDCFGQVLVRHDAQAPPDPPPPIGVTVDGTSLRVGNDSIRIDELRDVSSIARTEHTVAVTVRTSHHVFLIAAAPEAADAR